MCICGCEGPAESVQSRPSLLWPQSQFTADLHGLVFQVYFPTSADTLWTTVMNPLNLNRARSHISNIVTEGSQTAGRKKKNISALCIKILFWVTGRLTVD